MAEIKPFKGYRYALDKITDLGNFAAPPYDMIDSELREQLYQTHKFNCVRIIQNRPEAGDTANADRHARAAVLFKQWCESGLIRQDDEPGLYLYRQRFVVTVGGQLQKHERLGIVALVKLVDFSQGVVVPHEATLAKPKADRLELLNALDCLTEQIFGIVPDEGDLFSAIKESGEGTLVGEFVDVNGVKHQLIRDTDAGRIARITDLMLNRKILIADGHHRYETSLQYGKEKGEGYDHVMMTLVSAADPGLVILPFHRVINKKLGSSVSSPIHELMRFFNVHDLGPADLRRVTDFLAGRDNGSMLFCESQSQRIFELTLSPAGEEHLKNHPLGRSNGWNHLSVSQINLIFINSILGLPLDGAVLHDVIDYEKDPAKVLVLSADASNFRGAFFIRPLTIKSIWDVVLEGERMPQKSTNFFPKLFSGLVINKLGMNK